jgi:presenilin-like A22 family membrane protease
MDSERNMLKLVELMVFTSSILVALNSSIQPIILTLFSQFIVLSIAYYSFTIRKNGIFESSRWVISILVSFSFSLLVFALLFAESFSFGLRNAFYVLILGIVTTYGLFPKNSFELWLESFRSKWVNPA